MRKRIVAAVMLLLLFAAQAVSVLAAPPSRSYTYNTEMLPVASPNPYTYNGEINGIDQGVGRFLEPEDFVVDDDNFIYLLDAGNKRVLVFDENKQIVRVLDHFDYKGEAITLKAPQGLYIYQYYGKKLLYVSDTENSRIFRVDLTSCTAKWKPTPLPRSTACTGNRSSTLLPKIRRTTRPNSSLTVLNVFSFWVVRSTAALSS